MKTKQFFFLPLLTAVLALVSCSKNMDYRSFLQIEEQQKVWPVRESPESDNIVYINEEGKDAFGKVFGYGSLFSDGLALVKDTIDSELYGYINENGEYAIKPQYASATIFIDGVAIVAEPDSAMKVIDKEGITLYSLKGYAEAWQMFEGKIFAKTRDNKLAMFSSLSGEFTEFKGRFDRVNWNSSTDMIVARKAYDSDMPDDKNVGKWCKINDDGEIDKDFGYADNASCCDLHELVIVSSGENYGLKDYKGKWVVNPQYETIIEDEEGFCVKKNEKWGYIDSKGKVVIKPKYKAAFFFWSHKITGADTDSKDYILIDQEGKRVKKSKRYKVVATTSLGRNFLIVMDENSKCCLVNDEGEEIFEPQFDAMATAMKGRLLFSLDGKWGICDEEGSIIADAQYGRPVLHELPRACESQYYDIAEIESAMCNAIETSRKHVKDYTTMDALNQKLSLNLDLDKEYKNSNEIMSIVFHDETLIRGIKIKEWLAPTITSKSYGSYYYGYSRYTIQKDGAPQGFNVSLVYPVTMQKYYKDMVARLVKRYKMDAASPSDAFQYWIDSNGISMEMTTIEGSDELWISVAISEGALDDISDEDYEEMSAHEEDAFQPDNSSSSNMGSD